MEINFIKALLCLQRALLDVITPQLRAVSLKQENDCSYDIYFYYDETASDEALDLWSCAATEAGACLGADYVMTDHYVKINLRSPILIKGYYAYLKEEEVINVLHVFPVSLKELNMANFRLAVQNVLFAKIPDEVRAIIVDNENDNPKIWIYLDNENNDEKIGILQSAFKKIQTELPKGISLETFYHCIPYPQKIQGPNTKTSWYVYAKCENVIG